MYGVYLELEALQSVEFLVLQRIFQTRQGIILTEEGIISQEYEEGV